SRDGRAIYANKSSTLTFRSVVNGTSDKLLARPRLTQNENRRIHRRYSGGLRQHLAQRLRRTNDFLKHRRAVDFLSQRHIFFLDSLSSLFALLDIDARRVPANNASLVVPQRIEVSQKPTVLPVFAAHPLFHLKRFTTREPPLSFVPDPL